MKNKFFIIISLILVVVSYFFEKLIIYKGLYYRDNVESVSQSLSLYSLSFLIISFLIFFSKVSLYGWWKFARVYLPIAMVLIILSSEDGGGGLFTGGFGGGGYDREGVIWLTAGLFALISLIVIIGAWWKEKRS